MRRFRLAHGLLLAAVPLLLSLGACTVKESTESDSETGPATGVVAKLAAADAFDGTEDKVVTKCAGCALGMDGSADHALEAEGYTLHLCSAKCAEGFGADLDKSILAMTIPEK